MSLVKCRLNDQIRKPFASRRILHSYANNTVQGNAEHLEPIVDWDSQHCPETHQVGVPIATLPLGIQESALVGSLWILQISRGLVDYAISRDGD